MKRRTTLTAIASLALGAAGPRETLLAEPRPSIENPRRIVVSLAEADPARANAVFSNIINVQSFYGQDHVRILVVAYGPGVRHLIAAESQVTERVQSLRAYDIEFVACGSTLDALGLGPEAVIEGVDVVPNGLPEIVELSLQGWVHLRP